MDRKIVFELATGRFITQREDALFLGPPGTGKSHLAQAIGHAAILAGHQVIYMETHELLEDLIDAGLEDRRKERMQELSAAPLLIIDDLGIRKLPHAAAEDLLELIMRRYERASTLLHIKPPGRGLGQTPRRQRRRHGHAGSTTAPCSRTEVWTEELAHKAEKRLAAGG
jgi:DNA replication protein DnaC